MHADLKDWHAKAVASIKSLRSQNADVHAEIESLDQKLAWAQVPKDYWFARVQAHCFLSRRESSGVRGLLQPT
jgi:hypothetical protein